jgi:hypothetical protein
MLVILVFGGVNFNTWAGNKFEVKLNNPPRHFTTFSRYVWYAFLYTMLIEFVYVVILVTPGLSVVISKHFGIHMEKVADGDPTGSNFPLWLLIFLVSIVPNTPGLRRADQWVRTKLHQKAFIPAEADALVNQFIMHPDRFSSESSSADLVLDNIRKDIPDTSDIKQADNRLEHLWFKTSYLLRKINEWKERREIVQYYNICEPILKKCKDEYNELRFDIRSFFSDQNQVDENSLKTEIEYLEEKKQGIRKRLNMLLTELYRLICCGVLATQKTRQGRVDAFGHFGLKPNIRECPPIYLDIVISCAFLTAFVTFAATLAFHFGSDLIPSMGIVISYSMIHLFLQGASIIVAVIFYRWLSRKEGRKERRETATVVYGPVTDISIGALTGYLTGTAIIMMYVTIFGETDSNGLWNQFKYIWPWPMIPATTSGFIIYYLYSLDVVRKRLAEGMIQGGALGVVAVLAYIIFADLRGVELNLQFLLYCLIVCTLAGFAIGWTFPEEYRRRKKDSLDHPDRREHPRVSVFSKATLRVQGQEYSCHTINLSIDGAKLPMEIPQEVGADVRLDLSEVGEIGGKIQRKGPGETCLQLFAAEDLKKRLANFIGMFSPAMA